MGFRSTKPAAAMPVDALLPEISRILTLEKNLVVEAPPGAGKTTRIPPALAGVVSGDVIVLEPRRLAARLAARRVAGELGERPGGTVGYQVRFEEVAGPRTRLRYVTEGVLTRRLLSDPELRGVGAVVLDEFHERHLDGDLALALLRRLQRTARSNLRLLVMSATMDAEPLARFLGRCRVLRSEGRLFDLRISYTPVSSLPLGELVSQALERLLADGLDGDVLVFLPGAAEIRQAAGRCRKAAEHNGLLVLPLHGDLPPAEQDRAVTPASRRKLILSTNVAESSVTIEGVTAVIDSGLARVASHSPWSGLPNLRVTRISKASANQRAGRAGRTGPGRVIRLYPEEEFHRRPEHDTPEIGRRELSQACLELRCLGLQGAGSLEWLEAPAEASVVAAESLLDRLGALRAGQLTETGRRMANYPLHPRLSRLVVEAAQRGSGDEACAVAALLSADQRLPGERLHSGPSDLLALAERPWSNNAQRVFEQVRRVRRAGRTLGGDDKALLMSVLVAFPDRVAKRRQGQEFTLASGGSALLSASSVVDKAEWIVAADIEEQQQRGLPLVRLASAIEPEWLLDLFPERITESDTVEWNRKAERVEAVGALLFDGLPIEESRGGNPNPERAAALLAEKAREAGTGRFVDSKEIDAYLARVGFAAERLTLAALDESDVAEALASLCIGLRSFAELKVAAGGALLPALQNRLPPVLARRLGEIAPERLRLPGGRSVRVNYAKGGPPWIASRLQDFFGMTETPRVGGGSVPVVIHLLAPNHRPVQTTADLAGFWERWYPKVRRELSRRYPRHAWPEEPV